MLPSLALRSIQICLLLLGHQIPQRKIIHDILNVLHPVLEPVAAAAQAVVLQVEDLEAGEQVFDELVDQQRTLVVAEGDGVACEAGLHAYQLLFLVWFLRLLTSSSTSEMSDCRYSSRVRWNSSRSLRLTGTA